MSIPTFQKSHYGLVRALPGVSVADAIARTRAALATEGFGVLTEIDVQATLRAKLGAEVREYVILGACNPQLAHRALSGDPAVGLLLPCNVVVSADDAGGAVVAAVDPEALFTVVARPDIAPVVADARARLARALDQLAPA